MVGIKEPTLTGGHLGFTTAVSFSTILRKRGLRTLYWRCSRFACSRGSPGEVDFFPCDATVLWPWMTFNVRQWVVWALIQFPCCARHWFYFLCGVITVGKIMLWHFTKKCMGSRALMLFIKRCIWLNSRIGKGCSIFFRVLLLSTTGYSTVWYLPGRTTTVQTYPIFGLCWCAF